MWAELHRATPGDKSDGQVGAAVQGQQNLLPSAISASFLGCRELGIEGLALPFLSAPDVLTWLCAEVLIFWCVPSFSRSLTLQFL